MAFLCAALGDGTLVVEAAFMTAGMVLGLTIYALTSKTDFTVYGGLLWSTGAVLIIFSILSVFFGQVAHVIFCAVGVFFFAIYLIFDT